jgi:hypothetical protein
MRQVQLRIGAVLAVCAIGIVAGCSGGFTTIDTPDGGRSSSSGGSGSGGSSGGASSSSSGGSSGGASSSSSSSGGSSGGASSGSSSSGGGSSGGSGSCTMDADCGAGKICGFKTADGCSASGACFNAPASNTPMCLAYEAGCACDGTETNLACNGYPSGYASKPVSHTGACTTTVDAGGATCSTDADCGSASMCAFKIADRCAAVGICLTRPSPGPTCNAISLACTCSNKDINVACTMYPSGYASQPVAQLSACEGPDAGAAAAPFACGNGGATCPGTQVCKIGEGGAVGSSPSYTCVDYPAQCASMHTCDCVKTNLGAMQCSESGGNVTVTFLYPSAAGH